MTAGSKTFFLFHVTPSFQVTPFDGIKLAIENTLTGAEK